MPLPRGPVDRTFPETLRKSVRACSTKKWKEARLVDVALAQATPSTRADGLLAERLARPPGVVFTPRPLDVIEAED